METLDVKLADAIKKIILESEQGKFAKYGVIQNRKLRREVTTISRMTHKNIVRYYQAWVEGASGGTESAIPEEEEDDDEQDNLVDSGDVLAADNGMDDDDDDDDENDESHGWWSDSPRNRSDLPKEMDSESRHTPSSSSSDARSVSWSDDGDPSSSLKGTTISAPENPLGKYKRTDSALSQLLQHENYQGFGVSRYMRLSASGPRSGSNSHEICR